MKNRHLLLLLVLALGAAISGTTLVGCSAHSHATARCGPGTLRLSLQTQGESGTAVIFASLLNRSASTCIASGRASFEIEQSRERVKIQNNPLSVPVHLRLSSGQRRTLSPIGWNNWCGLRGRLDIVLRFDDLATRYRFNYLPRCDQPGRASQLSP